MAIYNKQNLKSIKNIKNGNNKYMFLFIFLIIIGFILLINGANFLVNGASSLAKKFHISEIVIGLTIVSIGTSMPELFISITSAVEGHSNLTIGNVVGSNISNLFLILGLSAIVKEISLKRETKLIDIPMCLFITFIFVTLCNVGNIITRLQGFYLIVLFILFIIYTFIMSEKDVKNDEKIEKQSTVKNLFYIFLGIIGLKFGGDLTVNNAVKIAETLNLSEKVISVTILAVGTSLPELVTSITAAIKNESDIAVGNILGSNIFNMLLIIGISSIIRPLEYNFEYNKDMIFLIIGTAILGVFSIIPPKNKLNKTKGIIFFSLYVGYMIILFI